MSPAYPTGGRRWMLRSEYAYWRVPIELYYRDKLQEAYEQAIRLDINAMMQSLPQINDLIEAELKTRRKSTLIPLSDHVTLEVVENEVSMPLEQLGQIVLDNCEQVAKRFQWTYPESAMVTILTDEISGSPAADNAYCADKYPYDKVCVPHWVVANPVEFARTVKHEFMHVVSLNTTNGEAPRWVSEMLSLIAEDGFSRTAWQAFRTGQAEWFDPTQLIGVLTGPREIEEDRRRVYMAYMQAALTGLYLQKTQGGDHRLIDFMKAMADESPIYNLELQVLGRTRADGALRRIYHVSEEKLFEDALLWIQTTYSIPQELR